MSCLIFFSDILSICQLSNIEKSSWVNTKQWHFLEKHNLPRLLNWVAFGGPQEHRCFDNLQQCISGICNGAIPLSECRSSVKIHCCNWAIQPVVNHKLQLLFACLVEKGALEKTLHEVSHCKRPQISQHSATPVKGNIGGWRCREWRGPGRCYRCPWHCGKSNSNWNL